MVRASLVALLTIAALAKLASAHQPQFLLGKYPYYGTALACGCFGSLSLLISPAGHLFVAGFGGLLSTTLLLLERRNYGSPIAPNHSGLLTSTERM